MTTVILFVLGLIIGSFLNVVALRWPGPEDVSIRPKISNFGGRSMCPQCSKKLSWYELVPILSFVVQMGRCRGCGAKISWQYPLVEVLTGLIFATVPLYALPVFCIYIVILIYDFHTKVIPDLLSYTAVVLSAGYIILNFHDYELIDLLAGPIVFLFFASIWYFSKGRAIGFGDAKLGLSVGLLLGAANGFSAIILSFWLGSLVAIFLVIRKGFTMKSEVPFAPFIILGAWLGLIFNLDLLHVALF
jgi:leader peptidase (prepilin peptidase) / N-methyltransferase